jgi:hypothetical protein
MMNVFKKLLAAIGAAFPFPADWLDDTQLGQWLQRVGIVDPLAAVFLALTPDERVEMGRAIEVASCPDPHTVASPGGWREGRRQLRTLNIGFFEVAEATRKVLKDDPTLVKDRDELAKAVRDELLIAVTAAGAPVGIDWTSIMAFIQAIMPLILMLIQLFAV